MTQQAWSHPIRIDDIPKEGARIDLVADEAVRTALARQVNLLGVSRLEAHFDLSRKGSASAYVAGRVSATVRQTCSVSLEPMDSEIDEPIAVTFLPSQEIPPDGPDLLPPESEEVEPIRDGAIDLGALASEFFTLGINPYPRKEGAVFSGPNEDAERSSPFDILAALKK